MLKEIETALAELYDVKLLKEPRPELAAQYRLVGLRNTGYFLYVARSLDYKTVFHLKSRLESILARFEQLETVAAEHALLSAALKEMVQAARAGLDLETRAGQEFEFLRELGAEYAFWQEGRPVVNSGLDPFTLATARQRLTQTGAFRVLVKKGELSGFRTEVFCLVVLSARPLGDTLRDLLQARLWWLTRAHRQATSELETIFHTFPDVYVRLDAEGVILDYKAHPSIPLPPDLVGKPIQEVAPRQEIGRQFTQAIRQVRETRSLFTFEYSVALGGRQHFHEVRLAPLQKTQIMVIVRDVTERKRAENALRQREEHLRILFDETQQAKEAALEASRLKSRFLASVSHDLRSPLGAILGYAELLRDGGFGPLSAKQHKVMSRIVDSTHYLTDLIGDLLDQAQIEAGTIKLDRTPFLLAEMVNEVMDRMNVLAQAKGLLLTTEAAADAPVTVSGDRKRMQQILTNLLDNAIKFTSAGAVRVRILRPDKGHWAMQVADTGPGIPSDAQAYIFAPFRQIEDPTAKRRAGVGLGLSITKQLVARMGGEMTLASEPGQGSAFTVLFPLETSNRDSRSESLKGVTA